MSHTKTPEGNRQLIKPKHVPQRSCVGCGKTRPKRELLRCVITEGRVEVDRLGKKAGRGAYVCPDPECWDLALKRNRLGHALRTKISPVNLETLAQAKLMLQSRSEAVKERPDGN